MTTQIQAPPSPPSTVPRPPAVRRTAPPRRPVSQRFRVSKSLVVGVILAVVLAGGTVFAIALPRLAGTSAHQLQITFPSADGLVAGSDVLEAGSKVGYISDIQPTLQNTALVTVEIANDHWPLHSGLTADIRPKSLLGEKYVDLHDGAASAPAYDASTVLHANKNADPVELDQFINSLDPTTRTAIRVLLDDLGAGVAGRGPDLNAAIAAGKADLAHLAVTGQTLDNRDPNLDQIIVGLDGILGKLTTTDQLTQMSQLITNGQNTLNDIEAVQTQFSRQFTDANVALADLNVAFDGAVPSLRNTLDVSQSLIGNLANETTALQALGASVTTTGNARPDICTSSTTTNVPEPPNLAHCSPLWFLVKGLIQGPTSAGGALELPTNAGIFRICLGLPGIPMVTQGASCDNSVAAQSASFGGGYMQGAGDAATFAAWLGT